MKTYQFKTNINCGGCIASVSPHLNSISGICNWKVDTANPEKILTVETDSLTAGQIAEIVKKAGFKAETTN